MNIFKKIRKKFTKEKPLKCMTKAQQETFTKRAVKKILDNAIVWVYLSYALAFLGRENIAEQLSINVVNVIIGVFAPYLLKALLENMFKYKWNGGDSTIIDEVEDIKGVDNIPHYTPIYTPKTTSYDDSTYNTNDTELNTDIPSSSNDDDVPVG